jgi:hypothetical protein
MFSLFGPRSESIDIVREGAPPSKDAPGKGITTTSTEISLSDIWHGLAPLVEIAGVVVLVAAFGLAAIALRESTAGLGALFHVPETLANVTALAVMLAFIGHCALSAAAGSNALKFWNAVSAVVWLVVSIALVATYNVMKLVGIDTATTLPQMTSLLNQGGAVVSPELLILGRLAYAVLVAVAMITLAVSIFGALGMLRMVDDDRHKTLGHVIATAGVTIVIVGAAVYSGLHMYQYGLLAGNDIFTAAMSTVLAEVTFITALKRGLDTGRRYYIVLAVASIGYAILVNWLAGRVLLYGIGYIQTDPLARVASDMYSSAGPIFAAAWGVMEWITQHPTQPDTDQGPMLLRIADWVTRVRAGMQAIVEAGRGNALPPPKSKELTLAKDEPLPVVTLEDSKDDEPFLALPASSPAQPKSNGHNPQE